jgi:hypothetical protein
MRVSILGKLRIIDASYSVNVGAAEGCDLLIFGGVMAVNDQDQKIAAFGSSYGVLS